MEKIAVYESHPKKLGDVEIVGADIIPVYAERGVKKFLREAPSNLRADAGWLAKVKEVLTRYGVSEDGKLDGGSPIMEVVLQDVFPQRDLIEGLNLLKWWRSNGEENPIPGSYIGFGLALRGQGDPNSGLAKKLFEGAKKRNIKIGEGIVPDYYMLNLVPSQNSPYGVEFEFSDLTPNEITSVGEYPWKWQNKDGVARAYLYGESWYSSDENLAYSNGHGRVARFSAEGTSPRILQVREGSEELEKAIEEVGNWGEKFKR